MKPYCKFESKVFDGCFSLIIASRSIENYSLGQKWSDLKAILTDHEQARALFVVPRTLSANVVLCCRRSLELGHDFLGRYWRSRCLFQLALLKDLRFESLLLQLCCFISTCQWGNDIAALDKTVRQISAVAALR